MCHTDFMKKSLLLFVPLIVCFASCSKVTFGYTNEQHSAGFGHTTSKKANATSYTYFPGDVFNTNDSNAAHITFDSANSGSNMAKEDINAIVNCDVPDFFNEVSDASWVGVKKDTDLFIGTDSSYVDGYLTLSFTSVIKYVSIYACPYYTGEIIGFTDKVEHDENVGVAVNNSSYIKLSYIYNEDSQTVNKRECRYDVSGANATEITIKVGPQRALISEIILYY